LAAAGLIGVLAGIVFLGLRLACLFRAKSNEALARARRPIRPGNGWAHERTRRIGNFFKEPKKEKRQAQRTLYLLELLDR